MEPNSTAAIVGGVFALVAAACLWFFFNGAMPRTTILLVLGGASGIAGSKLGDWGHTAVTWVNNRIADLFDLIFDKPDLTQPGTALWATGAVVLVVFVIARFFNRRADLYSIAAAAFTPLAAVTIPGGAGDGIGTAVKGLATIVTYPFAAVFGLT